MADASDAVAVLAEAMGHRVSAARYRQLAPAVTECLRECGCTTVDRIAMWVAQVGHESGGLTYMEELSSGAQYEGRTDLGNTQPGDGARFKGRGPIQVTGRSNYTNCSRWCYERGLVPTVDYFVICPQELASDRYGFLGVVWYWTTQRDMNGAADARDLERATRYVNGGLNGLEDRRLYYRRALDMGSRLLALLDGGTVADVNEVVLPYDRGLVPQQTGYWCGPASAEIVLNGCGVSVPEPTLAKDMGTTTNGTDYIQLVEKVLNKYLPAGKYTSVLMPNDPPTKQQQDTMFANIKSSIDAGYGLVLNWVAPPNNYPRGVKGSISPAYGPGTIYHYVACMGYDAAASAVWIADPGFQPQGYWISVQQCATLIPPKGYTYSTVKVAKPPVVEPSKPPVDPLMVVLNEVTQRIAGRTLEELSGLLADPATVDTVMGHAINAASLARINYELLRRIAVKLGVDASVR